ncbi:MAG TPA: ATP-binding cassette domain-containing protein [Burkholderiales bacterium]
MPLLRLDDVSLAYGHLPLLAHADFQIDAGERVCVVGRNGAGKSTLFRVIAGAVQPDEGEVWRRDPLRIAHLEQEVPPDTEQTVFDVVAGGLGELGALLAEYHRAAQAAAADRTALARLDALQARIEALDGWNARQKVESVLTRLALPADARLADCSGGTRRQVMLARALACEPDVLLLDEPTNHLDIAAITWLEEYLLGFRGALMFITHDRTFLKRLATRIVELDRGRLTSFPGDFAEYLRRKEEMLEAEARAAAKFDKELAAHEAWIRQGIKARRTRNEGRVRKLEAMRRERRERLEAAGRAEFGIDAGALSGKLVVDLRHVGFRYGERWIVHDFSTQVVRGDRIGIVGPNGAGKSTLLKLILGELEPTSGRVVLGTRLQTAYFDQHRRLLDVEKTVRDNLSAGRDYIDVGGRSRHVVGYLKDFLFPPERIDTPVKALSGGERNRLLLAKILAMPANMIVLDEPTNDLDVDTLELLEDRLSDYEGTLLVVSHDRAFLDNIVTSVLVFEGDGRVREYVGGYEDWQRYQEARTAPVKPAARSSASAAPARREPPREERPRKLSYKEQRELEALPGTIEALEREQAQLHAAAADPAFYQQPGDRIASTLARLERVTHELEAAYARWEALEALAAGR